MFDVVPVAESLPSRPRIEKPQKLNELEALLDAAVSLKRCAIMDVMEFCLQRAAIGGTSEATKCAEQLVARLLCRGCSGPLRREEVGVLLCLSDVLYNSQSSSSGATTYRRLLQDALPRIMEQVGDALQSGPAMRTCSDSAADVSFPGRGYRGARAVVRRVLEAWRAWDVFPSTFLSGLEVLALAPKVDANFGSGAFVGAHAALSHRAPWLVREPRNLCNAGAPLAQGRFGASAGSALVDVEASTPSHLSAFATMEVVALERECCKRGLLPAASSACANVAPATGAAVARSGGAVAGGLGCTDAVRVSRTREELLSRLRRYEVYWAQAVEANSAPVEDDDVIFDDGAAAAEDSDDDDVDGVPLSSPPPALESPVPSSPAAASSAADVGEGGGPDRRSEERSPARSVSHAASMSDDASPSDLASESPGSGAQGAIADGAGFTPASPPGSSLATDAAGFAPASSRADDIDGEPITLQELQRWRACPNGIAVARARARAAQEAREAVAMEAARRDATEAAIVEAAAAKAAAVEAAAAAEAAEAEANAAGTEAALPEAGATAAASDTAVAEVRFEVQGGEEDEPIPSIDEFVPPVDDDAAPTCEEELTSALLRELSSKALEPTHEPTTKAKAAVAEIAALQAAKARALRAASAAAVAAGTKGSSAGGAVVGIKKAINHGVVAGQILDADAIEDLLDVQLLREKESGLCAGQPNGVRSRSSSNSSSSTRIRRNHTRHRSKRKRRQAPTRISRSRSSDTPRSVPSPRRVPSVRPSSRKPERRSGRNVRRSRSRSGIRRGHRRSPSAGAATRRQPRGRTPSRSRSRGHSRRRSPDQRQARRGGPSVDDLSPVVALNWRPTSEDTQVAAAAAATAAASAAAFFAARSRAPAAPIPVALAPPTPARLQPMVLVPVPVVATAPPVGRGGRLSKVQSQCSGLQREPSPEPDEDLDGEPLESGDEKAYFREREHRKLRKMLKKQKRQLLLGY